MNTHFVLIMFFYKGLDTISHTSFLRNWFNISCIATIQPSLESASSTEGGSIIESSPNFECSSLKVDLVFLGLSLFVRIKSYRQEDLYLKVFLDCYEFEDPAWACSDSSTSGWVSKDGSTSGSLTYEVLIASKHSASDGLLTSKLQASGPLAPDVSSNT